MIISLRSLAARLAAVELWVAGAFLLAGAVSNRLLPSALLIAAIFWLVRWIALGRPSLRTPADWPIFLLVLLGILTSTVTALPDVTLPQVGRMLAGIALYYAVVNWTTSLARLRLLLLLAVLGGTLLSVVAPLMIPWGTTSGLSFIPRSLNTRVMSLLGDTVNANVMAGAIVLVVPLALALVLLAWHELDRPYRILAGGTGAIMTVTLVLIGARGALLGLAAALLVLVCLWLKRWWLCLLLLVIGSGAAARLFGTERLLNLFASTSSIGGLDNRIDIWARAIFMVQDFPLTGIGMGSFKPLIDTMYPVLFDSSAVQHAHNLLLQVAVDLGIPGIIAWLAIWLTSTTSAVQTYRSGQSSGNRLLKTAGAALCASQVALVVHGLLDAVTWGIVRSAPLVWILWGLTMASMRLAVRPREEQPPDQRLNGHVEHVEHTLGEPASVVVERM